MTSYSESQHARATDGRFAPSTTGQSCVDLDAIADSADADTTDTALRDIDKAVARGKISYRRGNVERFAVMGDFAAHLADTHSAGVPQDVTNRTFQVARTIDQRPGQEDTVPASIEAKYEKLAALVGYARSAR